MGKKVIVRDEDFLDELIREGTEQDPEFPLMVDAAYAARRLSRALAERREQLGLTQASVAKRMGTTQSALARLESGETDPRIGTLERYALTVGAELVLRPKAKAKRAGAAK